MTYLHPPDSKSLHPNLSCPIYHIHKNALVLYHTHSLISGLVCSTYTSPWQPFFVSLWFRVASLLDLCHRPMRLSARVINVLLHHSEVSSTDHKCTYTPCKKYSTGSLLSNMKSRQKRHSSEGIHVQQYHNYYHFTTMLHIVQGLRNVVEAHSRYKIYRYFMNSISFFLNLIFEGFKVICMTVLQCYVTSKFASLSKTVLDDIA